MPLQNRSHVRQIVYLTFVLIGFLIVATSMPTNLADQSWAAVKPTIDWLSTLFGS